MKKEKEMTLTVKRSKDKKTEIACGGIELWLGNREAYICGNGSRSSDQYLEPSRETFNALIKICQAAIDELDFMDQEEIKELEDRLAKLKKVDRST